MLERRVFSLPGLLHSAANLMGGRARQQALELTVHIDPALPEWIWGDELRLRQMVLNLLSNAIKFTPEGSVTLRARAEGASAMRIEVEDTGIGIEEAAQQTLFEAFTQADAATTRKYGGTGLGLAIVASLAEAMGGAVTVVSSPGRGSTFALCLPVEAGRSPGALPVLATERERGTRVLVVEDNPVNRLVAQRFLVELGCEVRLAADGVEALEQLEAEAVDVVLMDMHMPRMDGLGATREIRSRMGGALPVVGLTASVTEDDRQACFSAGMNAVLCKPLMMDDLREILDRYEPTPRDSEA
jgi:CheY-like chemotaxis protein